MRGIAAVVLLALASPAAAQAQDMPAWMTGCWEMRDGERWAEECWTIPRGGKMMGSGRTGTGDKVASFEFMRIERADGEAGLRFIASPGGNGWTPFVSADDSGQAVSFVNPDNEYPQRVRYWRDGKLLKARISLLDGSKAEEFSFVPMGG